MSWMNEWLRIKLQSANETRTKWSRNAIKWHSIEWPGNGTKNIDKTIFLRFLSDEFVVTTRNCPKITSANYGWWRRATEFFSILRHSWKNNNYSLGEQLDHCYILFRYFGLKMPLLLSVNIVAMVSKKGLTGSSHHRSVEMKKQIADNNIENV